MMRAALLAVGIAALFASAAGTAQAGTLRGTVKNGTTGAPAAGIDVLLLQLQSGMDTVANTKTDAQGAFTFDHPSLGAQAMLVRAVYRGVNFHQAVPPGRNAVQIEVFEPTRDPKTLRYATRVVIFQPNGASLLVGEEYTVQNSSHPPQAYFRADGSFELRLPEKAELQQVAAWGPASMPVVQATIDRGPNQYAIAFAFRPGENGVRLSYQMPYAQNQASITLPSVYSVGRLVVAAPPGVEVRAEGLAASGTEQGMNVYTREGVEAGKALDISVAGAGTPPAGGGPESGGSAGNDANISVQPMPGRLDVLKWPVIGGFAGLFALGAMFLLRKPIPAEVAAEVKHGAPGREKKGAASGVPQSAAAKSAAPATLAPPASEGDVHSAVATNLEALKDKLFRLELRRQAGTITEEEYARERAQTEQVLRDLVRG